jgi:hypothetical protein
MSILPGSTHPHDDSMWYEDIEPPTESHLTADQVKPSDIKAVKAVSSIKAPHPTPAKAPVSIVAGSDSAKPVIDAIKRAFGAGRVQTIALGGKHSLGAMYCKDPESGDAFLLKPGSGGQSPALGIREETASQSRREVGFWHVARSWGLGDYVPRAELILFDGKEWAAIQFLDWSYKTVDKDRRIEPAVVVKVFEHYKRQGLLHKWAVLGGVLGDADMHGGNQMVSPSGAIKLIDHGSSMGGPSFEPGIDKKSFVPYFLRYSVRGWDKMSIESKLAAMPTVSFEHDRAIRRWVLDLSLDGLRSVLEKNGINALPAVGRLQRLQSLDSSSPFCLQLNRLWLGLDGGWSGKSAL